jgi:hypothetical protein
MTAQQGLAGAVAMGLGCRGWQVPWQCSGGLGRD